MYFEMVRAALHLNPVTVRVVHPNCTDAAGLVRRAMAMYTRDRDGRRKACEPTGKGGLSSYDHVWVLFDTDIPERQGQLGPALELARQEQIQIGHSTPSVETWLLLHFRDRPGPLLDSAEAERKVGEAWGQRYDKSQATFSKLAPDLKLNISAAVARAALVREYHQKARTGFPPNPSTQLDLLIRALNASVQPGQRILP
jgi:hypothetical protein